MDDVEEKFSTIVDYSKFSVRIAEQDIAKVSLHPPQTWRLRLSHLEQTNELLCLTVLRGNPSSLCCCGNVNCIDLCSLVLREMLRFICLSRQIPDILLAFTQPQIEDMQRNLGKIWHRYRRQRKSSCAATSHVLLLLTCHRAKTCAWHASRIISGFTLLRALQRSGCVCQALHLKNHSTC